MLIIGEKEAGDKMVSIRKQGEGDVGTFDWNGVVEYFKKAIEE
jgi:threonyl-tRNA synthetase